MPALFSLALAGALKRAQERLRPGEVLLAYLDDLYLVTRPERVGAAYLGVTDEVRTSCGIEPNLGKTVCWNRAGIFSPEAELVLGADAWRGGGPPDSQGIRVLGAPLGSHAFCAAFGRDGVAKTEPLTEAVAQLPLQQHAWLLHYFCVVPRANHLLRQVPPSAADAATGAQDALTGDGLCQLLGQAPGSLPQEVEEQARLPRRLGGLGLRDARRTALAAYWASWADALPTLCARFPWFREGFAARLVADPGDGSAVRGVACLEELQHARSQVAQTGAAPTWEQVLAGVKPANLHTQAGPGEWQHGWQAVAAAAREQQDYTNLLATLPTGAQARLRSCGGAHAADWLTVAPTCDNLHLTNAEFVFLLRFRLGLPVGVLGGRCRGKRCRCFLDARGLHSACCMRSGRPQVRHALACSAWRIVLEEAGYRVFSERLLRDTLVPVPAGSLKRMDLVAVPRARGAGARRGGTLFCDVTIACPVSGRGLPKGRAAIADGVVVQGAVRQRETTYSMIAAPAFLEVAGAEVFGRWAAGTDQLINELAYFKARDAPPLLRHGMAAAWIRRWWGILSTGYQWALAQSILTEDALDMIQGLCIDPDTALSCI